MTKRLVLTGILLVIVSSVQAAVLRLDFAGDNSVGSFVGHMLLDNSVPDIDTLPGFSRFPGAVIGGALTWDGQTFDYLPGLPIFNAVAVRDNQDGDYFLASSTFVGPDSTSWVIGMLLRDSTNSVFSSADFPTSLTLSDFDSYDGSKTGTAAYFLDGDLFEGVLSSVELAPVPVPAAAWLFISVLPLALRFRRVNGRP